MEIELDELLKCCSLNTEEEAIDISDFGYEMQIVEDNPKLTYHNLRRWYQKDALLSNLPDEAFDELIIHELEKHFNF